MFKLRSRRFAGVLVFVSMLGLIGAGVAMAVTWEFEPKEELVFTEVGQEKSVTLTAVGGSGIVITYVTVGSEAHYLPSRNCVNAVMGKCTETVKCIKKGNAYLTFHPHPETPAPAASILMTC